MKMSDKIEHVVLLMLENRSLDNVLGWLYDGDTPRRFVGADTTTPYNGLKEGMGVSKGAVGATGTGAPAEPLRVPGFDPNEDYTHVNQQLFGSEENPTNANPPYGTPAPMAGFGYDFTTSSWWNPGTENPDQHHQIMEAYTPEQLPILNGLAKGYAVSDEWFSSVPTETNPNRAFSLCGTSLGCLDDGSFFPAPQQYLTKTIWEALPDGTNWGIYFHDNNYVGEGQCYTEWTFPHLVNARQPWNDIAPISVFYDNLKQGQLPAFTYLEPSWGYGYGKDDGSGFDCPGSTFHPGKQGNDYHPPTWMGPGEALVHQVYTALTAQSDLWKKTLFIITFDEHGGTYDHVDPGWNHAIEPGDGLYGSDGFRFDRYGVRVPTLLISPWIPEKTVFRSADPTLKYDHTSIIATLLKWQGVDPAGAGLWDRVARAPTFEDVLADVLRTDVPQYTLPAGYAEQGAACWQNLGESPVPHSVARGLLRQKGTREEVMARTKRLVESHTRRAR